MCCSGREEERNNLMTTMEVFEQRKSDYYCVLSWQKSCPVPSRIVASAGSESDLGRYDTDPRSGALVLYVTLVELVLYRRRRPENFRYNTV